MPGQCRTRLGPRAMCPRTDRTVCRRRDMRIVSMATVCARETLHRTCVTENAMTSDPTRARRRCCCCVLLTLVVLCVLPQWPAAAAAATVARVPPRAGVRQRCVSDVDVVASRSISADVVLEARVERTTTSSDMLVVRILTVFKGRRQLRRRLRLAVDFDSLASPSFTGADVDCVTSSTVGARLIVFLRRRHDDASLTYYVTSAGSRRRRRVDVYGMSALPAAVDERTLRTARRFSKRRNSECRI